MNRQVVEQVRSFNRTVTKESACWTIDSWAGHDRLATRVCFGRLAPTGGCARAQTPSRAECRLRQPRAAIAHGRRPGAPETDPSRNSSPRCPRTDGRNGTSSINGPMRLPSGSSRR